MPVNNTRIDLPSFSEAPKVHFHADQLPEHESEIVIRPESENSMAVHLGFLQVRLVMLHFIGLS